ncbi:MAG: hypothetical protein L6Q37_12385 [Bdellovibrionaceae bacterium]|nr:hypothetical protein [Pseudobdellovibrionaceae bacterium]NUM58168.1 hypothetical protein [Pseudobdellovibrionaceae bacterium]
MAEKKQEKTQLVPNNVVSLTDNRCKAEGCKSKSKKAEFCEEHFNWFKAGLITKEGKYVIDFEKKYQHYLASKKVA